MHVFSRCVNVQQSFYKQTDGYLEPHRCENEDELADPEVFDSIRGASFV